MAFQIVRNDIVNMKVDAIVNTANPRPVVGAGTDTAIHAQAGPELLEARKAIGHIRTGNAAITPAFGLDAKYVIHTVGPVWRGGFFGEDRLLRSCYDNALALAAEKGCKSIAFPLISTGTYGYPRDKAMQIAMAAFAEFLTDRDMQIYLVVFGQEAFRLSEKLFRDVASYIDEHYVQEAERREYGPTPQADRLRRVREADWRKNTVTLPDPDGFAEARESSVMRESAESKAHSSLHLPSLPTLPRPAPKKKTGSLSEALEELDAGFSETLLALIDRSGKKDSEIYNRAGVSRQHFSKIRNNPAYKPTKSTAIAFAIALELNMAQTKDLIGRAGYALTRSSKFDLIIMYFIENRNYNLYDINTALYEFDQSLLGA